MNLPYILQATLILVACLTFYKVLLQRETFYKVNRYMLLLCLVAAYLLPLLQVPAAFSFREPQAAVSPGFQTEVSTGGSQRLSGIDDQQRSADTKLSEKATQQLKTKAPAYPESRAQPALKDEEQSLGGFSFAKLASWLFWIYWFGVVVFGLRFLFQVALLLWRALRNPVIVDGPYRIIEVRGDKAPCSFANYIFINPEKYDWDTFNQILLHEKVHIREKHTLDLLIAEVALIFQWFNPFAWTYRREVESNLEFLTDDELIKKENVDRQHYQQSLVNVSAPHLPLTLTTNYNQSILKKRIAMMNKKRSSLHTVWKYFFLLPVFALLACFLNEPAARAQDNTNAAKNRGQDKLEKSRRRGMETEGYWFAIIKDDKVNIRFSDKRMDDEEGSSHSFNGNSFELSELGTLPRGTQGSFTINREAGAMQLTGKFEGNTGMGTYKFVADKAYVDYMNKELKEPLGEDDQMAFFFINIKKEFLTMLHGEGYKDITKDDLIPVAALGIDKAYIASMRSAGFKDLSLDKLVPLKALSVDDKYVSEIRSAGYKDISADKLVSFKAQGIDKKYIESVRNMKAGQETKGEGDDDEDDIVSFKAMNITPEYINSFKAVGITNIPHNQLVSYKAVGVTPEYIKDWYDLGFKNIKPEEFVGMKSQNVTPEYLKSFTALGYKDVNPENLVAFRALGITPEYIKSFETAGYKITDLDNVTALKAQGITPEYIKGFEAVGFKTIDVDEMISVKAVGVTPDYVKEMRAKGFNYDKLQKYVTLKSID